MQLSVKDVRSRRALVRTRALQILSTRIVMGHGLVLWVADRHRRSPKITSSVRSPIEERSLPMSCARRTRHPASLLGHAAAAPADAQSTAASQGAFRRRPMIALSAFQRERKNAFYVNLPFALLLAAPNALHALPTPAPSTSTRVSYHILSAVTYIMVARYNLIEDHR